MIPLRLALLNVATPEEFVVAEPVVAPLSMKLIALPFTPEPAAVRVADSVVVLPNVPEAGATLSEVAWIPATVMQRSKVSAPPDVTVGMTVPVYVPALVPDGTVTR